MRVVLNFIALVVELALIAGAAWVGARHPTWFAVLTVLVAFSAAATLEYQRLAHEMPFYFGRKLAGIPAALARVWSTSEAVLKSAVAGLVALLTFSGTDPDRLQWVAILFGVCVFIGTTMLLRISLTWGSKAVRWGYFRLGLPLGIAYSAGIYLLTEAGLLKESSLGGLAYNATFNLARNPSVAEASEFLFQLSQATDALIAQILATVIPLQYVPLVQIVASTNVLPGFVMAVFATAIARVVFAIYRLGGADV